MTKLILDKNEGPYNKLLSLEYLVKHQVVTDEWTTVGMYEILKIIIKSKSNKFEKDYLDKLLEEASDY
jgi:hypothetical protein